MSKTLVSRILLAVPVTLALLGAAAAWAAPAPAQLVPAQSELGYTFKQMGVPVEGKFKKFDAQVAFDAKQLAANRIAFTVDLASATLGSPEFDAELSKPAWFDSKKIPQATFQSSSIKAAGPGKFEVAGKLSIKGQSRDVVVPVAIAQSGTASTATGSFTIKRLAFKIGENEWADTSMVADDVQVKFKLVLKGVPPL